MAGACAAVPVEQASTSVSGRWVFRPVTLSCQLCSVAGTRGVLTLCPHPAMGQPLLSAAERVRAVAVGDHGAVTVSATSVRDLPAFVALQVQASAAAAVLPDLHRPAHTLRDPVAAASA
jgi:hypothetical protein